MYYLILAQFIKKDGGNLLVGNCCFAEDSGNLLRDTQGWSILCLGGGPADKNIWDFLNFYNINPTASCIMALGYMCDVGLILENRVLNRSGCTLLHHKPLPDR